MAVLTSGATASIINNVVIGSGRSSGGRGGSNYEAEAAARLEELNSLYEKKDITVDELIELGIRNMYHTRKESTVKESIKFLNEAADLGSDYANYKLGMIYLNGVTHGEETVFESNKELAFKFFEKGVKNGDMYAEKELGLMHLRGEGCETNVDIGISLLTKSSDKGHRGSKYELGVLHYEGKVVPRDKPLSANFFKDASDRDKFPEKNGIGDEDFIIPMLNYHEKSDVNSRLAEMYLKGDGVEKSTKMCHHYGVTAAREGGGDGNRILGDLILEKNWHSPHSAYDASEQYQDGIRRGAIKCYGSLGDLYNRNAFHYFRSSKAHQNAFQLYSTGSDKGDGYCTRKMADMLMDGRGVEQNITKAIALYEKAVSQGDKLAGEILGDMYFHGNNVSQSVENAAKWYSQSDTPTAFNKLALIHYNGDNKPEAAKCFQESGKEGHIDSKFAFAVMLDKGDGIEINKKQAAIEYKELADVGHISSQYNLGMLKLKGQGLETNKVEAANLFQTASSAGHMKARYKLGAMLINGDGIKKDKDNGFLLIQSSAESGYSKAKDFMSSNKARQQINKNAGQSMEM